MPRPNGQYATIIEHVFEARYTEGAREIPFTREDIVDAAQAAGVDRPRNVGDVIYSFRYRRELPEAIRRKAPVDHDWIIRGRGIGKYCFEATKFAWIEPNPHYVETKIPDSTPGVIAKYALGDEQALLAKVRYNRLIDIFTGVTCYSLQNHLRTTIPGMGQIEADEVYLGIDVRGAHYVFPVEAKGGQDRLSIVQIDQDLAMCHEKFPLLLCKPVAAQFIGGTGGFSDRIALFMFNDDDGRAVLQAERHYRLVPPDAITPSELEAYRAAIHNG